MDEVKRLREQAREAAAFAELDPTVANKHRFTRIAAEYKQAAKDREQMLLREATNPSPENYQSRNSG